MPKPNIVIIVLDTFREDHAQGLDRLLDYGFVKYQNAIAPAPWTLPSHVSMFTGLYPSEHEIHETKELRGWELIRHSRARMDALKDHNILAKLKDEGYNTYLISANATWVSPLTGFNADVNVLMDIFTKMIITNDILKIDEEVQKLGDRLNFLLHNVKNLNISNIIKGAELYLLRRLKRIPGYISERYVREKGGKLALSLVNTLRLEEPFLLFINLMEAHNPYTRLGEDRKSVCIAVRWAITGELKPEDRKYWRNYPQHAQRALERAIEIVTTVLRRYDPNKTLVIVTSDHGELLGDGGLYHLYSLKDGNIKVPLYVKYPEEWKKKKQKTYISLIDIPKILDPSTDTIGSHLVLAETFGVQFIDQTFQECGIGKPPDTAFHHKIRILSNNADILFNKTLEKIEHAKGKKAPEIIKLLNLRP